MTEKVRITQEQADAINYLIKDGYPTHQIIDNALKENWCNEPEEFDVNIEVLNNMDVEKLVLGVHGYCEVAKDRVVGDWVKVEYNGGKRLIGIIDTLAFDDVIFNYLDEKSEVQRCRISRFSVSDPTPEEIKTEKERKLWKGIGREVGEFREGDVGVFRNGMKITMLENLESHHRNGDIIGLYPAESFISFKDGDES